MKLLYAGMMALFATFAAPQVGHAAVYAAHLAIVANGNGTYDLSYRLNEEANEGVTINIKDAGDAVVRTITGNPTAKGLHTVQWDGKNSSDAAVSDGTYTWEVVASTNNPGDSYTKVDLGAPMEIRFGRPYSLAINKNTTSTHFGTMYVGNDGAAVNEPTRATETGIYVLGNDLTDITGQGDTSYKGNAGFVYPYEIAIAPNNEVFIADNADSNSNVFIMDPDNLTGDFDRLFDDTGRDETGLNTVNGTIYGLHVEGTGAETTLYTMDEEFGGGTMGGSAWVYNIGETRTGYATPPTNLYDDTADGNRIINFTGEIHKDTNPSRPDSWFLSQTRDNENETNVNYLHFDGTTVDWTSFTNFNFWLNQNYYASFDLNADGTRFAAGGFGWVQVIDISDLQNMNDDSVLYSDTGTGNTLRDVRFDVVENVYVADNRTELIYYYSKQGANTFTTPNPIGAEIVIGSSNVPGWELY